MAHICTGSSGRLAAEVQQSISAAVCLVVLFACAFGQQAGPAPRSFHISGTVVNSVTGQPLAQVRVFLGRPQEMQDQAVVITGTDGRFQFDGLSAGKYTLGAGKPGFLMQGFEQHENYSSAIVVGPELAAESLVFRIRPAAVISGQIVDEQNEPVRDAQVMLFGTRLQDGKRVIRHFSQATTDDRGQYRFGSLPPDTYYVVVSARPWYAPYVAVADRANAQDSKLPLDVTYPIIYYAGALESSQATPLTVNAGDHVTADFSLTPVRSLHIDVRTPKLNLSQGYSVVLMPEAFPGVTMHMPVSVRTTMTQPGEIEIAGLAPGQYSLQMVFPGKDTVSYSQAIDLQSDTEIDASASTPARSISGTVKMQSGSRLPPGATVILRNSTSGEPARAHISPDGQFEFDVHQVIPPGDYYIGIGIGNGFVVSVSATGAQVVGRKMELRGSGSVRLSIVAAQGVGHVEGTAVSRDDAKPIAGAMVLLVPDDPVNDATLVRRDQSDSDGTFTLANVVPGHYTLLAIRNGWDLEWMNPAVLKPHLQGGERVVVERNGKYNFRVRVQ